MAEASEISSSEEGINDLLEIMDEADLRAFALVLSNDKDSKTPLFSVYHAIYMHSMAREDLDMAINTIEELLPGPLNADELWAELAEKAGILLWTRFGWTFEEEDHIKAIELIRNATRATQKGSTRLSIRIALLAEMLRVKDQNSKYTEDPHDIALLLELHKTILSTPWGSRDWDATAIQKIKEEFTKPRMPIYNKLLLSSTVRNVLDFNSQYTKQKEDVDRAIEVAQIAVDAAVKIKVPRTVQETVQAEANYDLGLLIVEKRVLTRLQDPNEILQAMECLEKAKTGVRAMARRVTCLDKLSELLHDLHRITPSREIMQRSVDAAEEVLRLVPDADTNYKPGYLYNCANKLRGLHQADTKGGKGLLERALSLVSKALWLLPEPKNLAKWTSYKTACAAIMLQQYHIGGDIKELNEGIEICEEVSASGYNLALSGDCGEYWNILAGLLRHRYDAWELKEDFERAIFAGNEAVASMPDGHKEKGARLCNLSHMYWRRFSRLDDQKDLNKGIEKAEEALSTVPIDKTMRETYLTTLSGLLSDRYRVRRAAIENLALVGLLVDDNGAATGTDTAAEADINRSVSLAKEAAESTPPERFDYLINRNNYARVLSLKANSNSIDSTPEYIDQAIEILRSVIVDTPPNQLAKATRSNSLGVLLLRRRSTGDVDEAIELFDKCSMHPNAPPSLQISAATTAANVLISRSTRSSLEHANILLRRAVSRLRRLSPRSLLQKDQEHMIKKFAGLATLATSIALETGAGAEEALQMLEDGRGVILGLLFEVRSDLEAVRAKYPELAAEFEILRDELDAPVTHADLRISGIQPSIALTRREHIVQKFDEKVEAIRKDKKFRDFLKPPSVDKLKSASSTGPVIIINISRHRSDALIIVGPDQEVDKLPLQNLALDQIQDWVRSLQSREITQLEMLKLLEWLWDNLALPILDRLKSLSTTQNEAIEKPHVWWIPTGPLCSLPIHAAGRYTQGSLPFTSLLDKVVSSYSPSVKALLFTQQNMGKQRSMESAQLGNMPLIVAMGSTPGLKSLPYARREARVVRDKLKLTSLIKDGDDPILLEPKKSEVLAKLLIAPILHFAGHGKSDPIDPLQSALLVRDWKEDLLTVKDLMDRKLHRNPPFLAYLSACSTGSNKVDELLDEGLHLMSACQLVGFQHVIGSLWEVSDPHCLAVARTVFTKMADSGMSDDSVSLGLQEGVTYLRDRGRPGLRIKRDGNGDGDDNRSGNDSDERHSSSSISDDDEELANVDRAGHGEAVDVNDRPWLGGDPRIWAAYIHIGR